MLRVAIVDDEPVAREDLARMVARYAEENLIELSVTELSDGAELVAASPEPDIVLLDIEMGEVDGMAAAHALRDAGVNSQIIFVTNMAQYAIKGYEVGALDFVVKPVRYPVFAFKFRRAVDAASRRRRRRVTVETKDGLVRLESGEILYVEVSGHRLVYHTSSGDLELWGTMRAAAETLEPSGFALCNVCYLVNLDRVTRLDGDTVYVGDVALKMSRGKRKAFVDALTRSMGE